MNEDDGDMSVVILSDDGEDDSIIIEDVENPQDEDQDCEEGAAVTVNPKEALIQLVRGEVERTAVTLTFNVKLRSKKSESEISIGTTSMHNVSVSVSRPNMILKAGKVSDECQITFKLKASSPMRQIGVHIKISKSDVAITNFRRNWVPFQISAQEVDPECTCLVNPVARCIPVSHDDSDFIVLFFCSEVKTEKMAIAWNRKKPFEDLVSSYARQFPQQRINQKFKFTNMKSKLSCLGDKTPDSIGLDHLDSVFVSHCLCKT